MIRLAPVISTWFGIGRLPGPSGTWGSLAALPPAALLMWLGGPWLLALALLLVTLLGWWASEIYGQHCGMADAPEVVVDEVAGQWLPLLFLPFEPAAWLAAFGAFRFFDIAKPWPVGYVDRSLQGGFGVMADDILAGVYAAALLGGLWMILEQTHVFQ